MESTDAQGSMAEASLQGSGVVRPSTAVQRSTVILASMAERHLDSTVGLGFMVAAGSMVAADSMVVAGTAGIASR